MRTSIKIIPRRNNGFRNLLHHLLLYFSLPRHRLVERGFCLSNNQSYLRFSIPLGAFYRFIISQRILFMNHPIVNNKIQQASKIAFSTIIGAAILSALLILLKLCHWAVISWTAATF